MSTMQTEQAARFDRHRPPLLRILRDLTGGQVFVLAEELQLTSRQQDRLHELLNEVPS